MNTTVNATGMHAVDLVWAALDSLSDPEIPVVTLREMGILRDVRPGTEPGAVDVVITPTYSGCPAMGQIEDDVHEVLRRLKVPGRVVTQLAPAWTTDWMTDAAREKLRAYGIAPPQGTCASAGASQPLRFMGCCPGPGGAVPALWFHAHGGKVPLRLHGLQGAVPVPGLPRAF